MRIQKQENPGTFEKRQDGANLLTSKMQGIASTCLKKSHFKRLQFADHGGKVFVTIVFLVYFLSPQKASFTPL